MNTYPMNSTSATQASTLSTNKVIRNTYTLLSMTLLFSALSSGLSMALNLPHPGLLLTLAGYFGLLFATAKFRNSPLGIAFVEFCHLAGSRRKERDLLGLILLQCRFAA